MKIKYLLVLLFFIGCSKIEKKIDFIARVDDSYLPTSEIKKKIENDLLLKTVNKNYVNSLVASWIQKEALFQESSKYHFDKDKNLIYKANQYYKDLVIDAYLQYFFQNNVTISENEITNYYLNNKNSFIRSAQQVKVSHVYVNDYNDAKKIKSILQSLNQNKKNQLYSQYNFETKILTKGSIIAELDKELFETSPQSIIGPISSDYGFHIIKVIERYESNTVKPIDLVRDEIYNILIQQKIQANYIIFVDSLMSYVDYEVKENKISKILEKK